MINILVDTSIKGKKSYKYLVVDAANMGKETVQMSRTVKNICKIRYPFKKFVYIFQNKPDIIHIRNKQDIIR